MSRVAQTACRGALCGCALVALLLLVGSPPASVAGGEKSVRGGGPGAGVSIVHGRGASIEDWPWQVALTMSRRIAPRRSTLQRYFCGGSILAPKLVVTAGHCVARLNKRQIRSIEVVSGRTRLNSNLGEVARVVELRMPRWPSGKRRYRSLPGGSDWDVALLRLATPLSAEPIKLAGDDEAAAWRPGQLAWTTGWGVTRRYGTKGSPTLRLAVQVIMPDGLCGRANGSGYRRSTMICAGSPGGNASACTGDSGGPLVAWTSQGFRLVGLTSFGDSACRGFIPSIDARASGKAMRNWLAGASFNLTGAEVVGSGGSALPARKWCRVPEVFGLRVRAARVRIASRGCRLGRVRVDRWAPGPRGRIVGYSRLPGWLAPIGGRINIWIAS